MNRRCRLGVLALVIASGAAQLHAAVENGFSVSVLRDGSELEELAGRGNVYVEASKGAPYAIRLSNPLPYRVAVALSVDGLNTIDARHTDPGSARKWVIEPYGSTVIEGWQVSGSTARSFYFTGERRSYAAEVGHPDDLGVIEAVFFRERAPLSPVPMSEREPAAPGNAAGGLRRDAAPPQASGEAKPQALSDEFAATGMGGRRDHSVFEVNLDLERTPAAHLRIRYEFRPQLVALGVLPGPGERLLRRERSKGFSEYCPEPR